MRMEQREGADDVLDGRDLCGVALEELEASGHIREEVSDFDHDTRQQWTGALLDHLARPDAQPHAAAGACDVGHGADARQRPLEPPDVQLGLPIEMAPDPLRKELEEIDPTSLSPLEALQKLYQLRAKLTK